MIGSFLSRALALVLGYAYPAYECFKTVELNRPDIEQLRFWCQYWILVAALTVLERVGDTFISWLPMYSEAKLAFFVYLWYPKTRGTTYVYETFFQPYVAKHETEIDRKLLELRTEAGDMVSLYWQKAATYGQMRFFDILQYVASQSQSQSSRPRPARQRQQPQQACQMVSAATAHQPAVSQQLARPPPALASPTKSQLQEPTKAGRPPSLALPAAAQPQSSSVSQQLARPPPALASPTKSQLQEPTKAGRPPLLALSAAAQPQSSSGPTTSLPSSSGTTSSPTPIDAEAMQVEVASSAANEDSNPPQGMPIEEVISVTRRLRKRAATASPSTR